MTTMVALLLLLLHRALAFGANAHWHSGKKSQSARKCHSGSLLSASSHLPKIRQGFQSADAWIDEVSTRAVHGDLRDHDLVVSSDHLEVARHQHDRNCPSTWRRVRCCDA